MLRTVRLWTDRRCRVLHACYLHCGASHLVLGLHVNSQRFQ